jgi:hypothetical protein
VKFAAIALVVLITVNMILNWNTPAVWGWLVALAGWVPHMFGESS